MMNHSKRETGIGLVGAILLIAMMASFVALAAPVANQVLVAQNTLSLRDDLDALKIAITGNPNLVIAEGRADYGFLGTVGTIPASLSELWLMGSFPDYTFGSTTLVGAGWVGPYVPKSTAERLLELDKDPFGNDFIYTSVPFNRSGDGAEVSARIQSAGPDGIADTADDLLVDILTDEVFSHVTGVAKRKNNPLEFAAVTLNVPSNGTVTQFYDTTDEDGNFEFDNVSFGFRSLSIDAKLTYEDGTAKLKNGDTRLFFKVTNFGSSSVFVTSIRLTYTSSPPAYFEELKFGKNWVFDYADNGNVRLGSGDLLTFAPQEVKGSGKPNEIVPIRVESNETVAPDVTIKGIGKTVEIQVREFVDAQTGSGNDVSLSGVEMTVDFSDGSSNTFVIP